MAVGEFREDLFYRINVIPVAIPPLRLRREDILPLLHHYLGQLVPTLGTSVRGFTTSAELLGQAHEWPGNVRELRNRVERAVALAAGPWIGAADLFPDLEIGGRDAQEIAPLADVRDAAERRHIVAALEKTGGQVRRAAELLGVSRTTLWEKMKKLGVLGATNS